MGRIGREVIGCFNPFERDGFRCPVCGGDGFVELVPYGGVWCNQCNANFSVSGTCDGVRKIVAHCETKHVHNQYREDMAEYYWAVVWEDDEEITWLALKDGKVIA